MTFEDCLRECCNRSELVEHYNRLRGTSIGVDKRAPIERMVDEATGYDQELDRKAIDEFREFAAFVYHYIWVPVCLECEAEAGKGE